MYMQKCAMCGKNFIAKKMDLRKKYCSDECREKCKKLRAKEYYINHKKPEKTESVKMCKMCGKQFVISRNGQKYCSEECRRNANKKIPLGRRMFKCEFCGNPYEADAKRKYCSAECRCNAERSLRTHSKRKKPELSLAQINELARKEGLNYGQYVAKHGL